MKKLLFLAGVFALVLIVLVGTSSPSAVEAADDCLKFTSGPDVGSLTDFDNGCLKFLDGNDDYVLTFSDENDIHLGNGNDEMYLIASDGNNVKFGNGNDDLVIAFSSNNTVKMGKGDDYVDLDDPHNNNNIQMGDGNDEVFGYLTINLGPTIIDCGDGTDTVRLVPDNMADITKVTVRQNCEEVVVIQY